MKIAIAGASGFIGKHLLEKLHSEFQLLALSRHQRRPSLNIEWREVDLFSYSSTKEALKDAKIAVYLVHSMLPSTRLFQGNFQDTDLLLADNFSNSCRINGVEHIIYLGGLIPTSQTSTHLESRREVEEVFRLSGIDLTVIRSGMVIGNGGSSFEILKNLVINLPAMILPHWTKNRTQVIYIDDLISIINEVIHNPNFKNKTINAVNGEDIRYEDLIKKTSLYFNENKYLFPVPVNYTKLSKIWVKLFGQTDYELVSPLIDSLVCHFPHLDIPEEIKHLVKFKTYDEMLSRIKKEKFVTKRKRLKDNISDVRSIQRLPNPEKLSPQELSQEYIDWLPRNFKFLIKAKKDLNIVTFYLAHHNYPLLKLHRNSVPDDLDREKFQIEGGYLVDGRNSGWLEFRRVANGKFTLVSINEFRPSLPWFIYKYSQAIIHSKVMKSFGDYLSNGKQFKKTL